MILRLGQRIDAGVHTPRFFVGGEYLPHLAELLEDSLHSVLDCDEQTRTMCFRIWDLRALPEADVAALKQTLNGMRDREGLAPAEKVRPKLDWANVRVHYDDVSYCVEWHDRIWAKE